MENVVYEISRKQITWKTTMQKGDNIKTGLHSTISAWNHQKTGSSGALFGTQAKNFRGIHKRTGVSCKAKHLQTLTDNAT